MLYILLCIYAYKHGQTNAFLYSRKGAEALPRNEHIDLVIERGIVLTCVITSCFYPYQLLLVELLPALLAFSFWHNGAYYVMRKRIEIGGGKLKDTYYRNAWKRQSPTSTARFDFSYRERLYMLIASVVVLIVGYTAPLWMPVLKRFYMQHLDALNLALLLTMLAVMVVSAGISINKWIQKRKSEAR